MPKSAFDRIRGNDRDYYDEKSSIKTLRGRRHCIAATKDFLDVSNQWWTFDLLPDGKMILCRGIWY